MGALLRSLEGKRVAVVVGSGGLGQTSVAASIALSRAMDGGRALVCTIDPARRLASALGLLTLGNAETLVPPAAFERAGLVPRGQLFAMMLDVKRTWDDLVTRHAPDAATRDRILGNRIYQQVSGALAGSQEYMAMEKLYELSTERALRRQATRSGPTRRSRTPPPTVRRPWSPTPACASGSAWLNEA